MIDIIKVKIEENSGIIVYAGLIIGGYLSFVFESEALSGYLKWILLGIVGVALYAFHTFHAEKRPSMRIPLRREETGSEVIDEEISKIRREVPRRVVSEGSPALKMFHDKTRRK